MPPKAGFLTSEFWLALASLVVTVLVTFFGVPQTEADGLVNSIIKAVPVLLAIAAQASVVIHYIQGRTVLKVTSIVNPEPEPNPFELSGDLLPFKPKKPA